MSAFYFAGLILTLVALFGYVNSRFLKLPEPVGITAVALVASLLIALVSAVHPGTAQWAQQTLAGFNFPAVMFHGMLGLLLFAGSLHIDWSDLASEKWAILVLASVGVILSTFLVGVAFHYALQWLGTPLPLLSCLLFGALISPTDPIAVIGVLRTVGVAKDLDIRIAGESLFNDGTGVVVFLTLLGIATEASVPAATEVAASLALAVMGGLAIGLVVGAIGFVMVRGIDSYAVETLITLAMATAGYALAEAAHASAPIAVVIMGLVIGNQGKRFAMSARTRQRLFEFWDLADELLNLVLFGIIGLEVIALALLWPKIVPALLAIPLVLAARWVSVAIPLFAMHRVLRASHYDVRVMTWGGLRGGISVALALSLPPIEGRETIVTATYAVVLFSILVQGLTLGPLVRRLGVAPGKERARSSTRRGTLG